jgi:hypothetical protein
MRDSTDFFAIRYFLSMLGNIIPGAVLSSPPRALLRFIQLPSLRFFQARGDVLLFGHLSDSPEARLPYGELEDTLSQAYGPEACRMVKQARGVFGHKLNTVWKVVGPWFGTC